MFFTKTKNRFDFSRSLKAFTKAVLLSVFVVFASESLSAQQEFFWEKTKSISTGDARFPRTLDYKNCSYVFWEEIDTSTNQIWISSRTYRTLTDYDDNRRFAGPYKFSGEVPDIYSVAVSTSGTVIATVAEGDLGIDIYSTTNQGRSYNKKTLNASQSMIAPRAFFCSNGKFRVFTSVIQDDLFQLFYADSRDGVNWGEFKRFNPGAAYRNPFLPVSIISGSSDIVVFQAQYASDVLNRLSYQLFMTTTRDGSSWSTPVLLTGQNSLPDSDPKNFASYQNQRPNLLRYNNKLYMAWERTETINSSIWVSELNSSGLVPRSSLKITEQGNASRAILFEYDKSLFLQWFDTRNGNEAVYMAEKIGEDWEETALIQNNYSNFFSTPVQINDAASRKRLGIISQQSNGRNNVITALFPDIYVQPPKIVPTSYKNGKSGTEKNVTFRITFPSDTSGISGYSYTWGKDNESIPPEEIQYYLKDRNITEIAPEDGFYNLYVRVADLAGNWSEPALITYNRDLTPPGQPKLSDLDVDEYGFLKENTFVFNWESPEDNDIAGYNYQLEYLGSIPKNYVVNKTHSITKSREEVEQEIEQWKEKYADKISLANKLKPSVLTASEKTKTFNNRDNGIYKFTVCAVDEVGNVSEPVSTLVFLNKYKPQTYISSAYQTRNNIGESELVINGGGFTYEGTISRIYIDRDGKAPYDLVLYRDQGQFRVKSDSKITDVKIGTDLDEGTYKIGLIHTDRGLYMSSNLLKVSKNGTVKIESEYEYKPKFKLVEKNYKVSVVISVVIITILIALLLLLLATMIVILVNRKKEKKLVLKEIKSLMTGEIMPLLKNTGGTGGKRQKSLRGKLVGFTIVLVIAVTLFISLQNGFNMVSVQQKTMTDALENRIEVLMESLSSGVKNFLPTENDLEIGALPAQKEAMSEVKYITILGDKNSSVENGAAESSLGYLWATNDPDIEMKVADYGQNGILPGETYVTDPELLQILHKFDNLNAEVTGKVQNISTQIANFSSEITNLAAKTDDESAQRRKELSDVTTRLRTELNGTLSEVAAANTKSYPLFNYDILSSDVTEYTFYKPVLYRSGTSNNYLHGLILMDVSIQSLIDELYEEIQDVIISSALAALAALVLGTLGAWLLASLIVKPIKKLESHLEKVGTLMTKSVRERQRLEKEHIEISSKDEIGRLGDVVNQMTTSAGAAAYEEFLQLDGKAVQERFIPLEDGKGGRKLPIVRYNEEKLNLFAFYKGDSAVSGDYFDYRKLDDQWYVFIKCDISGHGVPAALLVSVVATKFKDFYYFSNWNYQKNGINLKKFVSGINDFIFDLGTRGKFSTVNISLYNKNTGELYICNAGDNKIHILDGATKKLREVVLSNTPTAGGVSTDLVEMTAGGYKVEKMVLNHGDVLYLYTDGIDEAERLVRDRNYKVKQTTNEEVRVNRLTGKEEKLVQILDQKEQFGEKRVAEVIEAVLTRKHFTLTKEDNPNPAEVLDFDFTNCSGTIEESIIALAAVERVFRMIKSPTVRESDEIEVENLIDEFLQKHFSLYSIYCKPVANTVPEDSKNLDDIERQKQMEDPNVTKYAWVTEDKQADDITLIAIKRP